jgi:hypothetical protein
VSGGMNPDFLRRELERVAPTARDFLLYNAMTKVSSLRGTAAAQLVHDILSGEIDGISPVVVAEMCSTIDHEVALGAFALFTKPYPFNSSHLVRRFTMHDSIPYIEEVRDGGTPVSPFMYASGVVEVGFHLCSKFDRDLSHLIHRKRHDETTYLYGCAHAPELLYQELTTTKIHVNAGANRDRLLFEFALRNPHHTERTRRHVISLLSCELLAQCFDDRLVDHYDVGCWIDTHSLHGIGLQIGAALNMDGAARLQREIIFRIDDIASCTRDMDLDRRRKLAAAVWPDAEPEEHETLALLMTSTRYDTERLYRIVAKLEADTKRRRKRGELAEA